MSSVEDWQAGGFVLYVHWPFCTSKCPYCDFNSHVRDGVDQARWRAALRRELAHEAARANAGGIRRPLASIFFGGGTPSLMAPETAAALAIARRIRDLVIFLPGLLAWVWAERRMVQEA